MSLVNSSLKFYQRHLKDRRMDMLSAGASFQQIHQGNPKNQGKEGQGSSLRLSAAASFQHLPAISFRLVACLFATYELLLLRLLSAPQSTDA